MYASGEVIIAVVISWAISATIVGLINYAQRQKYAVGDHKPLKYDYDNDEFDDEIDYKKTN